MRMMNIHDVTCIRHTDDVVKMTCERRRDRNVTSDVSRDTMTAPSCGAWDETGVNGKMEREKEAWMRRRFTAGRRRSECIVESYTGVRRIIVRDDASDLQWLFFPGRVDMSRGCVRYRHVWDLWYTTRLLLYLLLALVRAVDHISVSAGGDCSVFSRVRRAFGLRRN